MLGWTNPRPDGEYAYIRYNAALDQYKTTYYSKYKQDYRDFYKSLQGAKASMTRYAGFKTEWREGEI
jgi:flavodoxin